MIGYFDRNFSVNKIKKKIRFQFWRKKGNEWIRYWERKVSSTETYMARLWHHIEFVWYIPQNNHRVEALQEQRMVVEHVQEIPKVKVRYLYYWNNSNLMKDCFVNCCCSYWSLDYPHLHFCQNEVTRFSLLTLQQNPSSNHLWEEEEKEKRSVVWYCAGRLLNDTWQPTKKIEILTFNHWILTSTNTELLDTEEHDRNYEENESSNRVKFIEKDENF